MEAGYFFDLHGHDEAARDEVIGFLGEEHQRTVLCPFSGWPAKMPRRVVHVGAAHEDDDEDDAYRDTETW